MKTCRAICCDRAAEARGLCAGHYQRWCKAGDAFDQSRITERAGRGEAQAFLLRHVRTTSDDCIPWPYGQTAGYGQININGRPMLTSRRMCLLAHGAPPFKRAEAAHRCGNRICINPNHIRWATGAENCQEKKLHGTEPRGERRPNAKLTKRDVLRIRRMAATGQSHTSIARLFGVSRQLVGDVARRKTWTHV
jgi:hypothetical protein